MSNPLPDNRVFKNLGMECNENIDYTEKFASFQHFPRRQITCFDIHTICALVTTRPVPYLHQTLSVLTLSQTSPGFYVSAVQVL